MKVPKKWPKPILCQVLRCSDFKPIPAGNLTRCEPLIFLYLNDPPCPDAILLVVARALIHVWRSVATPNWRILIIKIESAFRIGRECTEGHTFRKIEGNYLL
jgi:hypothetical protein